MPSRPGRAGLGAANFARRNPDGTLTGTNTDGAGFLVGLRDHGFDPAGKRAILCGTGGVGRAIAFALSRAGLSRLDLMNRDRAKAAALAADLRLAAPACQVHLAEEGAVAMADLLINATSLGMKPGDPLPLDPAGLGAQTTVAEVIVQPAMTPLLQHAANLGCPVIGGAAMLKPQPRLVAEVFGLLKG